MALLHFFQGFVDVGTLRAMGYPEDEWCLPEVRGLTVEAGIALLDRAAEVGLLTSLGGGCYTIHPAVPWFFKSLFDTYYPRPSAGTSADHSRGEDPRAGLPMRAFVEAMGALGVYYDKQYESGNSEVIAVLATEEANLLHARRLARRNGWWDCVIRTMQGLWHLYEQTGRWAEWNGLVEEIVPDFVDPATDGPRPGREDVWSLVTNYRVRLAHQMRDCAKAERLQRLSVEWERRRAGDVAKRYGGPEEPPIVTHSAEPSGSEPPTPPAEQKALRDRLAVVLPVLSDEERNAIRALAVSLLNLGNIQLERDEQGCIASYEEALDLSEQISDRAVAAHCALDLGIAYKNIPAIRDLDQAERWYRCALRLLDDRDRLGRGECQSQLGSLALERFKQARDAGEPHVTQLVHLNAALLASMEALELIPDDAVDDRAITHDQLGSIYRFGGDIDRALPHYREAIRYENLQGDTYGAAGTCYNVALALEQSGRLLDACEYARAARDGFASSGAAEWVQNAQWLIERIDKALDGKNA